MVDLQAATVRRAATVAFVVYLLVLAGVAFLPLPGSPAPGRVGELAVDLTLARPDLLGGWETRRNVLMTVPFGLLLPLVVRWRHELLVLACVAVPLVIETGQLLVSLLVGWAWRSFDVNDLFNNTVGGLIGLGASMTAIALTRAPDERLPRPPLRRLVLAALAVGLVVVAGVSTLTTPPHATPVDACAAPPAGRVTQLPGEVTAYAAPDGSLCLQGPTLGSSSVPADTEPGMVARVEAEDGGGLEVGVALPGTSQTTDGRGDTVQTHAVEGADLRLWVVVLPARPGAAAP